MEMHGYGIDLPKILPACSYGNVYSISAFAMNLHEKVTIKSQLLNRSITNGNLIFLRQSRTLKWAVALRL